MLIKLLGKIFRFNQQTQAKIEWQQIDEPILLSWTTRGVVGNTTDLLVSVWQTAPTAIKSNLLK